MNYWEKRASFLENKNFQKSNDLIRLIDKEHKLAMKKIESDIDFYLSRIAKEGNLSVAEARKLLSKGELDHFRMSLSNYIEAGKGNLTDEIKSQLELASNLHHISRQQAMAIELRKHIDSLYNKYLGETTKYLATSYEESFYQSLYDLGKFEGFKSFQKLNTSEIDSIIKRPWAEDGQNFSDRIWKNQEKLINSLQEELLGSAMRGDKIDRAVKNLAEKMEVSKSNASRLIRTESAFISNLAMTNAYEKGTCEKYEILATLDLKTSEICRHMDGKKFPFKDKSIGVNHPPFHPNCRTVTIPCYDDDIERRLDQKSGRIARDPETGKSKSVENLSYEDWYKKYVEKLPNNNQGSGTPNEPKEPMLKYTEAETNEAIEEYVSGDGMWINNKLRGIGEIADYPLSEDDKIYLEKLDQATQGQIVKERTLYRSLDISSIIGDISDSEYDDLKSAYIYNNKSKPAQEAINKYLKNIEGKEIVDKGFISTTKDKEIALDFQDFTGSSKPCVIEFNVPNGVHGIDLKDFDIADMEQKEVLLARNQKFVIREVRQEQGQFYFKADLVAENGYNINENLELPKLKKIFGEDDYKEFKSIISENKNEDIQKLYRNYGDKVNRVYIADNCKYSYKRNELFVRINSEEEIEDGIHKFSTLAHEYGHFFDHNAASNLTHTDLEKIREVMPKSLAPAEDILSSSDEFMKAIREDKERLKSIGIKKLTEELINDDTSKGVQDAIDGMFEGSKNKIKWGHGEKYYNRKFNKIKKYADLYGEDYENTLIEAYKELGYKIKNKKDLKSLIRDYETASEAWANITSAVTCGGDELVYVKKYLPKSLEALLKIIKEVN